MKKIQLTKGKVVLVDDEDYEELNKNKWYAHLNRNTWYAERVKNKKTIKMHRQILKYPSEKYIDHINHDGLDNRKENLRTCTNSQNKKNGLKYKNNTSGFNGVSWRKDVRKWMAYIRKDNRLIFLGYFQDRANAGRAVDKKAKELFGDFAVLNFKEELK